MGLKNGGATCYINSVLQQLYAVPGISDQLLAVNLDKVDEDSAFFQLQVLYYFVKRKTGLEKLLILLI